MNDIECQEQIYNYNSSFPEDLGNWSFGNFKYGEDPNIWKEPNLIGYIKLVAYAVVIIGGLLGNISVILIVAFIKNMRTTINIYITNLAAADAFICLFCMIPHALEVMTENKFVLGSFMCKFNPFTQMVCLTCSVLTLSAISCDRFIAILLPLYKRVTKQKTPVVLTMIWAVSIAVSLPLLVVKELLIIQWKNLSEPKCIEVWPLVYYYDESSKQCNSYQPLRVLYYGLMSATLFFLPIVIMITAYSLIVRKLWKSDIPGEQHESNIEARTKTRKKVIKMVCTVLVAFILCWTPLQVKILYSEVATEKSPYWLADFEWFSYYIANANSFINPIIYGGLNESFREGFSIVVRCQCKSARVGRLARWRSTLSTALPFNSSRVSNFRNCSNKSEKINREVKLMHPITSNKKISNIEETCVNY